MRAPSRRRVVLRKISAIGLVDPIAELVVLPDGGANGIDEVHLARAEQIMFGRRRPLHPIPGGVLLFARGVQGQRPDPHVRGRSFGFGIGCESMETEITLLLVVAAIHEIAENVGVVDGGRSASPEIRSDLVPSVEANSVPNSESS